MNTQRANYRIGAYRGFTLIELLVVISIIGMLSSTILVALSQARGKGKIAASIVFATNLYHGLGDQSFFYWNFNNTDPDTVTDISGNNYTGSLYNSAVKDFADSPTRMGASLDLSSGTSYAEYNIPSSDPKGVDFSDGGTGLRKHTVSVWVKPNVAMENTAAYPFGGIVINLGNYPGIDSVCWNNRCVNLDLFYDNGTYKITGGYVTNATHLFGNPTWTISAVPVSITSGTWSHIAYTYNGSIFILYVDGKEIYRSPAGQGPFVCESNDGSCRIKKILVGSQLNNGATSVFFNGKIDDAAVFGASLSAGEIQHIYAAGLPTHTLAQQ